MNAFEILQRPRWEPLSRFVETWYAEPLGSTGLPIEAIERKEAELGVRLPLALREWYALVGHRFYSVNQDYAVRLHELRVDGDRLPVWHENQGNWSIDVELSGDDDEPWASVTSDEPTWHRRAPLAAALLGMVYSDTLVGVWSCRGAGPLGKLASKVVGGYVEDPTGDLEPRAAALPVLDVFQNPYFSDPLRGHDTLVVRGSGFGHWEWMAASPPAEAEATSLFDLHAGDLPRILVLVFTDLDLMGKAAIHATIHDRSDVALGGVGRLASGFVRDRGSCAKIEIETGDPLAVLEHLCKRLPWSVIVRMRAGHRSQTTSRFVACWPPGSTDFTMPEWSL